MIRRLGTTLFVVAAVGLAGCSGAGSDGATPTTGPTTAPTTTVTTSSTSSPAVDQTSPIGVNGIKVAADGTLWVASLSSDVVLQVDADSGTILRRVATPAGSGPDDVALDDGGVVFWTGFLSGAVGSVVVDDDTASVIANVGPGANPIAIRGDGTLIVGRAGLGTGLFAIDPGGGAVTPLADPGNVNSFDISPDGVMYAPSMDDASVLAIDPDTGATVRTVATLDATPIALRWHDDALFVLTLSDSARVVKVNPSDGTVEPFGDTGLAAADNLAVGDDGRVYVTGLTESTITVLGPDGSVERTVQVGS